MRKTLYQVTPLLTAALILFTVAGCKKSLLEPAMTKIPTQVKTRLSALPNRKTQVYIGIADYWAQQADPANYNQWNYVRHNADGFYANFISMWQNKYQTSTPQQNINNMRSAFINNGVFFETSLETQVNDGANGANNQTTDQNSIDALSTGGFNVNNTSLNYGVNAGRVNTLKTYQYNRTCMALEGPWLLGGDINGAANAQIRQDILATDGVELDGPMGFWYSNGGSMRAGTYSAVQFAHSHGLLATILLSPYNAGQSGYNATNDFFNTSKQCVLNCEDNNAAPDIWAIWTYGEDPGQPAFPESATTNGQVGPANTMMGVGYWLLKHLNNLPQLQIPNTGAVGNNTSVNIVDNTHAQVTMNTLGDTTSFYSMPIVFSNSADPKIEISPVISAALSGDTTNWKITFKVGTQDVTNEILNNGGLNCIAAKRITNSSNLNLVMNLKAKNQAAQPISVNFTNMSNIGNTGNTASYSIIAQTQSGLVNGGIYQITNRYVNKVLEFAGAGTANGTLADLFDWNGTLTQRIRIYNLGNGYSRLTPMHATGACLDNSGSLINGAQSTLWEWNGGTNQMWSLSAIGNGFYKITNLTSGKVLEDTGFANNNGAAACQWDYVGGTNQQWKFTYLGN